VSSASIIISWRPCTSPNSSLQPSSQSGLQISLHTSSHLAIKLSSFLTIKFINSHHVRAPLNFVFAQLFPSSLLDLFWHKWWKRLSELDGEKPIRSTWRCSIAFDWSAPPATKKPASTYLPQSLGTAADALLLKVLMLNMLSWQLTAISTDINAYW